VASLSQPAEHAGSRNGAHGGVDFVRQGSEARPMTLFRLHMKAGSVYHNYGLVIDNKIEPYTIHILRAGDGLHRVMAMSKRTFDENVERIEPVEPME
jgi:hypothetical protein